MKRAKRIEAVLSIAVCLSLVFYGLSVLRADREIGPIVPDSQVGLSSSHASCGAFCWLIIGWLVEHGTNAAYDEMKNNSCNGPCGGGGGGGFECDGGDWSDNCRKVL